MAPDVADELAAWLRLLLTPGIGRGAARRLLSTFGTPQAVFAASASARAQCLGQGIVSDDEPATLHTTLEALLAWLETTATIAGVELIFLEARVTNQAARSFYKARGYRELATMQRYYSGREDAVRIGKDLAVAIVGG